MTLLDHKYIFWLELADHKAAVVIDWTDAEAKQRARMRNPYAGWEDSTSHILTQVRKSMTSRVVAMED